MGVEKNIVAIELGSSAIRAIVGQKKPDGSLQVLGYEKETAPDSIHKGAIYNIDKTISAISSIIKRIEERQKVFVNRAYVGVSGQSLRTVGNSVSRQFDVKVAITEDTVDSLKDENLASTYAGAEILDAVPQEYRLGSHLTSEPIGIMSDRIEGYYKNIIARRSLREDIERCLKGAKIEVVDFFISPLILSSYLLSDTEKRSGCALVDFGAETTTVAIYEKNILRHLVVIPLGGNNITADIATSQHLEHEEAEMLKRTYGSAFTDEQKFVEARQINISSDRKLDEKLLMNLIEARQQEILENVWEQIKNYSDRLLSGIIFTGGAANMRNLETAFTQYHHFDKVKTRQLPATTEFTTNLKLDPQTATLATLVAMLRRGDQECTSEKPIEPDLFETQPDKDPVFTGQTGPASNEGVVRQQGTKADDPVKEPEAETTQEAEATPDPQPKKPGAFSRFGKNLRDWANKLVEAD